VSGSVRFRSEQISAVTDSVPEQRQPDRMIANHFTAYWNSEQWNVALRMTQENKCFVFVEKLAEVTNNIGFVIVQREQAFTEIWDK